MVFGLWTLIFGIALNHLCFRDLKVLQMKYIIFMTFLLNFNFATAQEEIPDTFEAGWKGKTVCEIIEENDAIRMFTCTYPPGGGQDKHYHDPYMGYIVQGGTLRSTGPNGTRESTSVTGQSFNSTGVEWHALENIGDTTVIILGVEHK